MIRPTVPADTPTLLTLTQGTGVFKPLEIEALREVLAWGDAHFNGTQTVCLIHPENVASLRLADKFGYQKIRSATYKDRPAILLAR